MFTRGPNGPDIAHLDILPHPMDGSLCKYANIYVTSRGSGNKYSPTSMARTPLGP